MWQRFPVYPGVHLHENPPIWSVHSPLAKHGFESHSLYSKLQSSPEKPMRKNVCVCVKEGEREADIDISNVHWIKKKAIPILCYLFPFYS